MRIVQHILPYGVSGTSETPRTSLHLNLHPLGWQMKKAECPAFSIASFMMMAASRESSGEKRQFVPMMSTPITKQCNSSS